MNTGTDMMTEIMSIEVEVNEESISPRYLAREGEKLLS